MAQNNASSYQQAGTRAQGHWLRFREQNLCRGSRRTVAAKSSCVGGGRKEVDGGETFLYSSCEEQLAAKERRLREFEQQVQPEDTHFEQCLAIFCSWRWSDKVFRSGCWYWLSFPVSRLWSKAENGINFKPMLTENPWVKGETNRNACL